LPPSERPVFPFSASKAAITSCATRMVGARSYRKSEHVHRLGVEGIGARRSSPWRCYAPIGQGKNSRQETPVTGDFSNFAITTKHLTIVPAHPGLKLELRTMSVNPQTRIGARFHRAQRPADPCLGSSVDQTNPNSSQPEPNETTCTSCETNPTHLYRRRFLPAVSLAGRFAKRTQSRALRLTGRNGTPVISHPQ